MLRFAGALHSGAHYSPSEKPTGEHTEHDNGRDVRSVPNRTARDHFPANRSRRRLSISISSPTRFCLLHSKTK